MIAIRKNMENPVKKVLEKPLLNWEKDLQHRQLPYHNHKLAQLRKVKARSPRHKSAGIRLSGLASHEDNS